MMLHWSPLSPFVRKVMIALHEKRMVEKVRLVRSKVVFSSEPNPEVLSDNPLGKIPTLVMDDGKAFFDSRVICELLDTIEPEPRLFPIDQSARLDQLRWQALADGLLDILLLLRIEATRAEKANPVILSSLALKARTSMAALDREAPDLVSGPFAIGQLTLACVLGYLDFRYADSGWREVHPNLDKWYEQARLRQSVTATAIPEASTEGRLPLSFTHDAA